MHLILQILISCVSLIPGDSDFSLKFGVDLFKHFGDFLNVSLPHRLEVVFLFVDEKLGILRLCFHQFLDKLNYLIPIVGIAEAQNLGLHFRECLHVCHCDLKILL